MQLYHALFLPVQWASDEDLSIFIDSKRKWNLSFLLHQPVQGIGVIGTHLNTHIHTQ